jgi:hypothetical protein
MSIALDEIRERAVSVSQGAYRVVRAEDFDALVTEVERLLAQRVLNNEDFARSFDMGLAAGERRERTAVVAWLRAEAEAAAQTYTVQAGEWANRTDALANAIERGEHRKEEP